MNILNSILHKFATLFNYLFAIFADTITVSKLNRYEIIGRLEQHIQTTVFELQNSPDLQYS